MSFKPGTRLSNDDIEAARRMDTKEVISSRTGWTFQRAGSEWHCKEHDALVIFSDGKGWTWYSRDVKGASAIDWLMKIEGLGFQDAISELVGNSLSRNYTVLKDTPSEHQKPKSLMLPPKAEKYSNVYAYLNKTRKVSIEVIQWCVEQHILYQDDHNNCVFIGKDSTGKPRFATRRGTYTKEGAEPFKKDCIGSSKSYGFCMEGSNKEHIYVFEAAIDAMSHASLGILKAKALGRSDYKTAWQAHTRLALGGVADNALKRYLAEHPSVREISFCLDNDDAGRTAAHQMSEQFAAQGYKTHVYFVPQGKGKDYNEYLCSYVAFLGRQHNQNNGQLKTVSR